MQLITKAGEAIRGLELRLAGEGLFVEAELEVTAGLKLAWVRDRLTRRWRLMSRDKEGREPQPRPLVEQPAAVKLAAFGNLERFEDVVRVAWSAHVKRSGLS